MIADHEDFRRRDSRIKCKLRNRPEQVVPQLSHAADAAQAESIVSAVP
jgi:hypothetical protein